MEITQQALADSISVSYQRVIEIVNGSRGITSSTALRLAKLFGTSPEFWLNLQMGWDLYQSLQKEASEIGQIKPLVTIG